MKERPSGQDLAFDDGRVSVQNPQLAVGIDKEMFNRLFGDDTEEMENISIRVLGMNGQERVFRLGKLLQHKSTQIKIPGSNVKLEKQSVKSEEFENAKDDEKWWQWTVLFNEKRGGKCELTPLMILESTYLIICEVTRASKIDIRVGIILDGAVIYYDDRHTVHCGPRYDRWGQKHEFGKLSSCDSLTLI